MMYCSKAFKLSGEAVAIADLKKELEKRIEENVANGHDSACIEFAEYSDTVRNAILEWLHSYKYKTSLEKWNDSRSGWSGEWLNIIWAEKDQYGNRKEVILPRQKEEQTNE